MNRPDEDLQRQVRALWQVVGMLGAACMAAVVGLAVLVAARPAETAAATQVLTVKAPFKVVDASGKTIFEVSTALTGATPDGRLRGSGTYDERGRLVAAVGHGAMGQGMVIIDPAGGTGISMGVGGGTADLNLYGHPGMPARAHLESGSSGGRLDLTSSTGEHHSFP